MKDNQTKYKDLIKQKLDYLEKLHNNVMLQEKAIKDKDEKRLISLLDKNKNFIDAIHKINIDIKDLHIECCYEEENLKSNELIKCKVEKIYQTYFYGYVKAQELIEELKSSIKRVNLEKKAIFKGYMKRQQQLYGYFIDKRVGKSYRY